jgi:hypothetical protein
MDQTHVGQINSSFPLIKAPQNNFKRFGASKTQPTLTKSTQKFKAFHETQVSNTSKGMQESEEIPKNSIKPKEMSQKAGEKLTKLRYSNFCTV